MAGCQGTPGLAPGLSTDRYAAMLAASRSSGARVTLGTSGLSSAQLQALGTRHHLKLANSLSALGSATFTLAGASAEDLSELAHEQGVTYLEQDVVGKVFDTERLKAAAPNDPGFGDQWDMQRMETPDAWSIRAGSSQVVVGMIDTGIDLGHPDLAGKIVSGTNITQPGSAPQDDLGHGTATAGIVGATANNGIGLAGVAPNARLMAVKVNVPGTGQVRAADAAAGVVWAADHGANILNMSIGFAQGEDGLSADSLKTLKRAVSYALGKGVLVVCAAGNIDQTPEVTYPAVWAGSPGFEGVIAVGATDRNDSRAGYSNYGPWLTVVAPADDIPALAIGGYGGFGGTSAAAPHVSGLAALLMTPGRPPAVSALRDWIVAGARDLGPSGRDDQYGAGCVDALRSIQASTR